MFEITRREEFCAAHHLCIPSLSDEENERLYGKCFNPHYHGHNYVVEVTLRGERDPETGMVFDLAKFKGILRQEVIEALDHKNLNEDAASFMKNRIPTAENIALSIWERLVEHVDPALLYRVRLYENERNFVDYYGDGNRG